MSLVNLAHVCSHLQNAARARLGLTSIPYSKLHLALSVGLLKEGFISSVTTGSSSQPDAEFTPPTQTTISTKRLWLGLKYYENEPVMSKLTLVSKPKQRIWLGYEDLKQIGLGKDAGYVKGAEMGECIFVSTDRGIMELREAVKKMTGGQVLCRVR
ncbi:hypothetical protein AOL_s00004g83 [Orbilia oligospora ATCC 24927]|uniref:Small ribosomal subunit protein uS8m n=1 Tax=Arthrobotrys oligospora (strain ATCC 24927 / CBS 115.81 / DSM 1491) TaxID=756982 RepID=G1WXS3_ARTOA|nr:hypothetical protein AOL_s00004g83 [Orbilia oligospora ATCC 24927]EGX54050.1 hypothetical protein AOL_s00004g83 [Orbilia oligospora ATCC 24927]